MKSNFLPVYLEMALVWSSAITVIFIISGPIGDRSLHGLNRVFVQQHLIYPVFLLSDYYFKKPSDSIILRKASFFLSTGNKSLV